MIILKWVTKKQDTRVWNGDIWLRRGIRKGFGEKVGKPTGLLR
jgi:hypothetical protein